MHDEGPLMYENHMTHNIVCHATYRTDETYVCKLCFKYVHIQTFK